MSEPAAIREIHEIAVVTTGTADIIKLQTASEATRKSLLQTQQAANQGILSKQAVGNIQNAAFQVQDFAVQVAAGTSAFRAFAQQAPQFLSVLGPIGVGLGVIAALMPLVFSIKGARDFQKDIEDSAKAIDALAEANKRAAIGLGELTALYGSLAPLMQSANKDAAELAKRVAETQLATLLGNLRANFGEAAGNIAIINTELEKLRGTMATVEETIAINEAFKELQAAASLEDILREWTEFRALLEGMGLDVDSMAGGFATVEQTAAGTTQQIIETRTAIENANAGVADLEAHTEAARLAAVGLSDAFRAVETATASLAASNNLKQIELDALRAGASAQEAALKVKIAQQEMETARAAATAPSEFEAMAIRMKGEQAVEIIKEQAAAEQEINDILAARRAAETAARKSSGGGSGDAAREERKAMRELEQDIRLVQRAIESTWSETRKATEEANELEAAWARIGDNTWKTPQRVAEYEQALKELRDLTVSWADVVTGPLQSGFDSAFSDMLAGTKSVEDAFTDMIESVLSDLAKLATSEAFKYLLQMALSSAGSSLGFSYPTIQSSQAVAEQTRAFRAITPAVYTPTVRYGRSAYSTTTSAVSSQAKGGFGGTTVNIYNNAGVDVSTQESQNSNGLQIDVILERKLKQAFGTGTMDRSMQTNFGVRRRPTGG